MGRYLKYRAKKKSSPPLHQLIQNAPDAAEFFPYQTVGERIVKMILEQVAVEKIILFGS